MICALEDLTIKGYLNTCGERGPQGEPGPQNLFIAQYGVTSLEDITTAFNGGKTVICKRDGEIKAQYILCNLTSNSATFSTVFDTTSLAYTQERIIQVTTSGWSSRNVKLQRYSTDNVKVISEDNQPPYDPITGEIAEPVGTICLIINSPNEIFICTYDSTGTSKQWVQIYPTQQAFTMTLTQP